MMEGSLNVTPHTLYDAHCLQAASGAVKNTNSSRAAIGLGRTLHPSLLAPVDFAEGILFECGLL
jgi:hypothetical protein